MATRSLYQVLKRVATKRKNKKWFKASELQSEYATPAEFHQAVRKALRRNSATRKVLVSVDDRGELRFRINDNPTVGEILEELNER